jgi:hypothetical protein
MAACEGCGEVADAMDGRIARRKRKTATCPSLIAPIAVRQWHMQSHLLTPSWARMCLSHQDGCAGEKCRQLEGAAEWSLPACRSAVATAVAYRSHATAAAHALQVAS